MTCTNCSCDYILSFLNSFSLSAMLFSPAPVAELEVEQTLDQNINRTKCFEIYLMTLKNVFSKLNIMKRTKNKK